MNKNEFNARFRRYVRDHLSPTDQERGFISTLYGSVQAVLGEKRCLQIGSYPRYTAIRPLHDLDVLYVMGEWDPLQHEPKDVLTELARRFEVEYENPTGHRLTLTPRTHCLSLCFHDRDEEVFAVDVVPAYLHGHNEFGDDTYKVPEIVNRSRAERSRVLRAVASGIRVMDWIATDPRGYIRAASNLNSVNADFRKAAKFIKAWKNFQKQRNEDFPLKSFHLEQIVTRAVERNPGMEIFDMVFAVFCDLYHLVRVAQIPDRADGDRYIDAYVEGMTEEERAKVDQARDGFLVALESFGEQDSVEDLLQAPCYQRWRSEEFLFDQRIPMLVEGELRVRGEAWAMNGFRRRVLNPDGVIEVGRKISFSSGLDAQDSALTKWKVRNDDRSPQPRGEITDGHTLSVPEHTQFKGRHFVECYAIQDGVCVARGRQDVVLRDGL